MPSFPSSSHSCLGRRLGFAVAWTALVVCIHALPASSTTVREGSIFEDLEWADAVVTATVGASRVESDHRGVPQTIYELLAVEGIKGDPPFPFEIRIDGGALDSGIRLEVPGVPEFSGGDRVLLFLRFDNPIAPIIGLQARTFRIVRRDGATRVTTYDGRPVTGFDSQLRVQAATSAGDTGLTVRQFVAFLKEMMARPEYQDRSR